VSVGHDCTPPELTGANACPTTSEAKVRPGTTWPSRCPGGAKPRRRGHRTGPPRQGNRTKAGHLVRVLETNERGEHVAFPLERLRAADVDGYISRRRSEGALTRPSRRSSSCFGSPPGHRRGPVARPRRGGHPGGVLTGLRAEEAGAHRRRAGEAPGRAFRTVPTSPWGRDRSTHPGPLAKELPGRGGRALAMATAVVHRDEVKLGRCNRELRRARRRPAERCRADAALPVRASQGPPDVDVNEILFRPTEQAS